MEIRNNDGSTNTQTRDNIDKLVLTLTRPGSNLWDGGIMKTCFKYLEIFCFYKKKLGQAMTNSGTLS